MSKLTTIAIQDRLVELGERIGLKAVKEYTFYRNLSYNPRYDVVWFLNVESLNIQSLVGVNLVENKWLPLATFEVEGSTTSSKNQVGNVGNLMISPCQYHFIIVANKEAGSENDTYRRGIKIVRTMQELLGNKSILFLDASMLPEKVEDETFILSDGRCEARIKGSGGETVSIKIAEKVVKLLETTKLTLQFDYTSDYFKMQFKQKKTQLKEQQFTLDPESFARKTITTVSQYYYCPKVDISAGFQLAGGFLQFLKHLKKNLREDGQLYPLLQHMGESKIKELYYPLLGIEIESGDSKHAIGGLMNAGRLHQIGWLVGTDTIQGSVETYQYFLGLRNTYYIPFSKL